jgi:hypothetical protein
MARAKQNNSQQNYFSKMVDSWAQMSNMFNVVAEKGGSLWNKK